jgi:hypothetical protein
MGVPQCTLGETPAALNTVAPKQSHLEVDMQQDHQAIVARACRKMNRLMLPFALLFRSASAADQTVTVTRHKHNDPWAGQPWPWSQGGTSSLIHGSCLKASCGRIFSNFCVFKAHQRGLMHSAQARCELPHNPGTQLQVKYPTVEPYVVLSALQHHCKPGQG